MKPVAGFISGCLFALGLSISGMLDPSRVLAFLDVAGPWNPSLAFVLAGAVAISFGGYRMMRYLNRPLYAEQFEIPATTQIDTRLLSGAALFGVGWGLAGFCPGPAVASLSLALPGSLLFVASMLIGMAAYRLIAERPSPVPV